MKSAAVVIAAIAVQLAGQSVSWAYQMEPISRVFAPSGARATQSFEITNSGAERIALTVSFATLERDESYAEINRDAEDDFLAYPAQMILAPGARQTLRVTWLGTPHPARELTYRIIVSQVPLEQIDHTAAPDTASHGQMRLMMNYRGTLFIRPPNTIPSIQLASAAAMTGADGKPALAITLENVGGAVGLVKTCSVRLATPDGPVVVASATDLAPLNNTRVLGASKRRYVVSWPAGLARGPVKATGRCVVEP